MAEFKIVISDPKNGRSYQFNVKDEQARPFLGLKIGAKMKGEVLDLTGYEFEITGGSDHCGFPMRKDVEGVGRKKIFAVSGVGIKKKVHFTKKGERKIRRKQHGIKQKKTVCGNTIHAKISQVNLKILKCGKKPLGSEEKAEAAAESAETIHETKAAEKANQDKETN